MYYIIAVYILGAAISLIGNAMGVSIYYSYLSLNFYAIAHGQIWRLVTFILQPISYSNIIFLAIELYFYWSIGRHLENAWGAFRFNLYYLTGIIFQILAGLILYLVTKDPTSGWYFGIDYINQSMFLAFCVMYPELQVLLMFVIPIKVKYMGIIYGAIIAFQIFQSIMGGAWYFAIAILVAIGNFVLFWFSTRNMRRFNPKQIRRHVEYKKATEQPKGITRHKCAICGRTELDAPNMTFRFCSKCNGNYEYCEEHLFTHTHVM